MIQKLNYACQLKDLVQWTGLKLKPKQLIFAGAYDPYFLNFLREMKNFCVKGN